MIEVSALREHLGRLVLKLFRSVRYVHRLGQPAGRHQEPVIVDQHLDGLVIHQKPVLDAVDAGFDGVLHRFGAVRVCRDAQPAPMRLVDDRTQFLI